MSTISAGTTTGTALVNTGDTSGQLVLQTNGTTTAVTIGTNQVVTLAQPLPVNSGGMGVASLTANNVILGNGTSAVQFVAPGTNGNVLTSNGTTWTSAAPATGAMVYLGAVTASAATTVDVNGYFTSSYDNYLIIVNGATQTGVQLLWRALIGGVAQTDANYSYAIGTGGLTTGATSGQFWDFGAVPENLNLEITIQRPLATAYKAVKGEYLAMQGTATPLNVTARGGYGGSTTAWSGIQLRGNSGTVTGTFRVYGIKNS